VVTLRELLTHTAGLTVQGFPGYAARTPIPTLVQILNGEKSANSDPVRLEAPPAGR
jgi:CubicO group peptidase (beta-lactamase class C family)